MDFPCQIERRSSGEWVVRYAGAAVPPAEVSAGTREAALQKMRNELQYRLELCPCTGEMAQHVDIRIVEATPRTG